jgi:hypothetical protein
MDGWMDARIREKLAQDPGHKNDRFVPVTQLKFYLPSQNVIRVLFSLLKCHQSSICPL